MATRRHFLAGIAATAAAASLGSGCSAGSADDDYDEAVRHIWRPDAGVASSIQLMHELVRYATLAPSSHNTQCWKFRIGPRAISILPDLSRRCPTVDPDDHHLFVSLGCATENLRQAAIAHGLNAEVAFDPAASTVQVGLAPTKAQPSPLFDAITTRQCSRTEFDAKQLSTAELTLLERAATGNGVRVLLLTDRKVMENVLEYVLHGNTRQMNDPAFVGELRHWIRFSAAEAVHTGDGLFSRCSGNPSVPPWLGNTLFGLLYRSGSENARYVRHLRSSSGLAVFVSDVSDRKHWLETGRCYERFALQATALGIRNAHLNQPVEVAEVRSQLAHFLNLDGLRPDLVIRFGRGPEMPRSLRRPIKAVLA
ncbi:Tat pathway signal protein [Paraburkholderia sp. IMGN_8]|uniref:Acg family FMN-binding oxidoreductase n=1 Tax=Paraburkholderia sp. IMGN_8 TaxID=3136564 RepID=UPI0031010872